MILLAVWLAITPPIDCEAVKAKVAEYGEARAIAWAIRNGYGWRQIREARKCLTK